MTTRATPYADFAARLQLLCDRAGIGGPRQRTAALANRLGVARETARLWLTGCTLPELTRLIEIVNEFSCSLDWLLLGREPKAPSSLRVADAPPGYADYAILSTEEQTVIRAMRRLNTERRVALVALLRSSH